FDGNDHTISNFSYTSEEATGAGLFTYMYSGRIKNLGLIAPKVQVEQGEFHGCLVGLLAAGTVTHCYVESGSVTGQDELGGLVGENGSGGAIINCYFTGETTGKDNVGGLVGYNKGSATASYSYADVEGQDAVGGLVGRCSRGEIVNCYAQGNVVGHWYVGGLVGTNGSGSRSSHSRTGAIRNCYSASTILMGSQKGGLLGADWGGEVSGSFWDIETSGQTKSYGGEGKTTAKMQTAGTFLDAGWDFVDEMANGTEDIWWILQGRDYPRLWWEPTEDGE
ncbi:MAG: GLUG motif-containing protein, partial [Planctomycetota bacterium]